MDVTGIGGFSEMRMDPAQFAQKRFEKLDANTDGGIDKAEFAEIAERIGLDADEVFTQYDVNEDGKLDQTEEAELFADKAPKGPPPGGKSGMMGGMGEMADSDDALQSLLDALQENEDDDEESVQSLLQSFLQKNGTQYGNSGLFGSSAGVSTFSAIA